MNHTCIFRQSRSSIVLLVHGMCSSSHGISHTEFPSRLKVEKTMSKRSKSWIYAGAVASDTINAGYSIVCQVRLVQILQRVA